MTKRVVAAIVALMVAALSAFAGGKSESASAPEGPQEVLIRVWAIGTGLERWRAMVAPEAAEALNEELAAEGSSITVITEPVADDAGWSDYKRKFALAAESGTAPEIILSGHEDIATWAQAGYLVPIADTVSEVQGIAPEYADVFESLWTSGMWRGQIWAVPQDTEARPMFFSKSKLADLGWSQSEIDALPQRIMGGQFTLEDMIDTAQEAVDKGVVEPGHGYWHRPSKGGDFVQYYFSYGGEIYDAGEDKLIIDRSALEDWYAFQRRVVEAGITPKNYIGTDWSVWHDTVANDKALFWNGGIWQWSDWATNYNPGGEEVLFETVGYALQPAGRGGEPGTLSHPLVYMVTSEKASGTEYQDLAIRLLAKMSTAELNTRHAVESTHLGILESQMEYEPYAESEFLADVTYMLDHNYYQPNHTMFGVWFDIVWGGMVAAEHGEKSPADAADDVIKQLELELGDVLVVRD